MRFLLALTACVATVSAIAGNHNCQVTPLVGNGTAGFSGDGGLAANALLNSPTDVAYSRGGVVVFVSDTNNRRIRKIEDGIISTLAVLERPMGITANDDVVTVCDYSGRRVIQIDIDSGSQSVLAGTGVPYKKTDDSQHPPQVGHGAVGGNGNGNREYGDGNRPGDEFDSSPSDGDGVLAADLNLANPYEVVAWRDGYLFTDNGDDTVRYVDGDGLNWRVAGRAALAGASYSACAQTNCGDGAAARRAIFQGPTGITINPDDSSIFFIVDAGHETVRSVQLSNGADVMSGIVDTIFGVRDIDTILLNPTFLTFGYMADSPTAVQSPMFLVSDSGHNRVKRYDIAEDEITTVMGGHGSYTNGVPRIPIPAIEIKPDSPHGICLAPELKTSWIVDQGNNVVYQSTCSGYPYEGEENTR